MKKKLPLIAVAALLVIAVVIFLLIPKPASDAGEDMLARIRAKGKLAIATEGDWPPWTYHDDSNALTGFDVEIGGLIAKGLGVEPDYQEAAWDSLLAGLESGRFDIVCNGVDYSEDRAKTYAFSDPYVYTEIVLVVAKDNEDIHTIEDLKGKTTSNSPNSTYAQRALDAGATVEYADTLAQTLRMVEQGRVQASINSKGSVEEYLESNTDANLKVVLTIPGDPVCFPMAKGEDTATLVAEVNRILAGLRADGTLAALSEKYFGADMTNAK